MAFTSSFTNDPTPVGGGERVGDSHIILSASTFEDGLLTGRFAKLDSGSVDNMDGSSTPTLAGIVLRHVSRATEDEDAIRTELYANAEYARWGLVTVFAKDGESVPARFATVYASNAGDADDGLATSTDTDIETTAEFIDEVQTGVWLVFIK